MNQSPVNLDWYILLELSLIGLASLILCVIRIIKIIRFSKAEKYSFKKNPDSELFISIIDFRYNFLGPYGFAIYPEKEKRPKVPTKLIHFFYFKKWPDPIIGPIIGFTSQEEAKKAAEKIVESHD